MDRSLLRFKASVRMYARPSCCRSVYAAGTSIGIIPYSSTVPSRLETPNRRFPKIYSVMKYGIILVLVHNDWTTLRAWNASIR